MKTVRLASGDTALAKSLFSLMTTIFDEPRRPLEDEYVSALLARPDFWAIAAIDEDGAVVGGLTAHALPMTREQGSEIFIYDIAVRPDMQRRGIGRSLVAWLREATAASGIQTAFVLADDEDDHAIEFYRALGARASPVTSFTFERRSR